MENGKARKSKKDKPARALLEPVSDDGSSSFARALGSVDFQTREKGLQALTVYLSRSSQLSALAMRKLWKGIFYCFWHSDKAPTQVRLPSKLTESSSYLAMILAERVGGMVTVLRAARKAN